LIFLFLYGQQKLILIGLFYSQTSCAKISLQLCYWL